MLFVTCRSSGFRFGLAGSAIFRISKGFGEPPSFLLVSEGLFRACAE